MIDFDYRPYLPPELRPIRWQTHPLDGKLLLFDRATGLNILLEGDETAHFRRIAPRTLLIAVTNACNLTCPFCYRDLTSKSGWRNDTLMQFCREADAWGVLEVAFGGGEPTIFPNWADFLCELYATTGLCANFTTNGMLLTDNFLQQIAGQYGQIRVSLYEDNDWANTIPHLVANNARFGVNWLITPAELERIESKFAHLFALGVRDFLLLSYKGADADLHLSPDEVRRFSAFVRRAYEKVGAAVSLKLDICWGDALGDIPRLFSEPDCGAGDDFLSITSDKRVKGCSFMETGVGVPFETLADVRNIWEARRFTDAARIMGCARLPARGLNAVVPLDAVG